MTSVARVNLSFTDNCGPSPCLFSSTDKAFFPLDFAGAIFPLFPWTAAVDFEGFFRAPVFGALLFGSKRSVSVVTVVCEHVDVEPTASRIESAVAWKETMMIENTLSVLLKTMHYPESVRVIYVQEKQ